MATVIKPSPSDEVVDPEEQLRITHEIKTRFESMAPKRPIKPNRSEPDPDASLAHQTHSDPIPELQKLLSFKSDHNQVDLRTATGGELVVQEEFVETQYYKQLVSIDKQHHTTGTGFIRAVKEDTENGEDYELPRLYENGEKKVGAFSGYKSNPATNDWSPNVDQNDDCGFFKWEKELSYAQEDDTDRQQILKELDKALMKKQQYKSEINNLKLELKKAAVREKNLFVVLCISWAVFVLYNALCKN